VIVRTDIESIKRYRSRLGEELYEQLAELWYSSEKASSEEGSGEKSPDMSSEEASPCKGSDSGGGCPICGHAAEVGVLLNSKEEGRGAQRMLWCAYCEHQWSYDRIRCVRCGTRSQDALSYHFDEGDIARRIYYCDDCEGTLKVLCEKNLDVPSEVDLRLEGILMAGLEQAVREHCARRKVARSN